MFDVGLSLSLADCDGGFVCEVGAVKYATSACANGKAT